MYKSASENNKSSTYGPRLYCTIISYRTDRQVFQGCKVKGGLDGMQNNKDKQGIHNTVRCDGIVRQTEVCDVIIA